MLRTLRILGMVLSLAVFAALPLLACSTTLFRKPDAPHVDNEPKGDDTDNPKASARERAREKFTRTVDTWAAFLTWTLIVVGVAALILSFTTLGATFGISPMEAGSVLGLSALIPLVQYALTTWGILASDVLSVCAIVAALAVGTTFLLPRIRVLWSGALWSRSKA